MIETDENLSLDDVFFAPVPEFAFDLERLKKDIFEILEKYPMNHMNQLCLTSRTAENQSVYEGVGQLFNYETKQWSSRERDYTFFNKDLENNYVHEVYQKLKQVVPWNIARVRIMKLESRRCYSFHNDADYRLHIALDTNPQCFLMFLPDQFIHIPADGVVYFTNTLKTHSAMNGGRTDRYHLVFSTYE